jgi:hypothetical protein
MECLAVELLWKATKKKVMMQIRTFRILAARKGGKPRSQT